MVDGAFNGWVVFDDIDSQSRAFGERTELVVYWLGLYRIQRNESSLTCSLVAHILSKGCHKIEAIRAFSDITELTLYLYAINGRLLFINHDGVYISA